MSAPGPPPSVASPFAWLLNLDAELELARPGHVPSAKLHAQLAAHAERAHVLLGPRDVLVDEARRPAEYTGRAWCPTPRAVATLSAAGVEPEPHPSADVLRAANHRRFSAELGAGPPGSEYVEDAAVLARKLQSSSDWLLKRALSFAGRGQLYVRGSTSAAQASWIEASLRLDGIMVEPRVRVLAEFGLHGFIRKSGGVGLGRACVQMVSERGVWQSSRLAGPSDLEPQELRDLVGSAERVAEALGGLGYFGPFGIDAYRYETL
ncbi:MAG TPA: hypothetical protein VK524_17570, partial [Polyangiaceae bacterium]|nr:hypothetical protein [Polyangiaceae bacterium]